MRSTKLWARVAMCVSALALSCARGVDPDPEDISEPGAASAATEEPTGADDAEEDAGAEEVAGGTGEESDDEDEDRARDEGDMASDAALKDWTDAGAGDAQTGDADAGDALDAGVAVIADASSRAASEDDAAQLPESGLDATSSANDAGATGSDDASASTPATPAETESSAPATDETSAPTAPADEAQEPVPTPADEPVAPPESESSACSTYSDCAQQPCFPLGLLACCRADGSCGCSWAPGAYCL